MNNVMIACLLQHAIRIGWTTLQLFASVSSVSWAVSSVSWAVSSVSWAVSSVSWVMGWHFTNIWVGVWPSGQSSGLAHWRSRFDPWQGRPLYIWMFTPALQVTSVEILRYIKPSTQLNSTQHIFITQSGISTAIFIHFCRCVAWWRKSRRGRPWCWRCTWTM
jgi:hypothetical protein